MKIKIIETDTYGQRTTRRVALPVARWEGKISGCNQISTGVFLLAVYIGRKNVVLKTYSQWVRHNSQSCEGDTYSLATENNLKMIERICGEDVANEVANIIGVPVESI